MKEIAVVTLVIGILIIVVIGAILFSVIDKFCPDARLAQLLKQLVVLVCLGAIVNRLLPLLGYPSVLWQHQRSLALAMGAAVDAREAWLPHTVACAMGDRGKMGRFPL
jgi:hypothetical protein